MSQVRKHFELLGMRIEDSVTGFKGVVESISFDLYGCIQVVANPGLDKDGKQGECKWFDVSRLKITSLEPVMARPNFDFGDIAEGKQGAAEKPILQRGY